MTGASRGIGPYIAQTLAKQGMNLVLAARSAAQLETLADHTRRSGVKSVAMPVDLREPGACQVLISAAMKKCGPVDVLVNNAGAEMTSSYHKLPSQAIERIIQVNLTAPMLLARLVLPEMLERRCGHIVNMSSLAGKVGPPFCEPYAATKAGLIAFTQSLRIEYRGTGVSASVICPGNVQAGIYQRLMGETGLTAPSFLGTSTPESVALAVVRCIKKDIPEIIVNPGPARWLTALAELSPSLAEYVMRRFGVADWFKTVAAAREAKNSFQSQDI